MATPKSPKPTSSRRSTAPLAVNVAPRGDGWQIKREGASRASSVHVSKADAVSAAAKMIRGGGGMLRVHGQNGRIQEYVTIGRKAAAKISAVEGSKLDGQSKRDLKAFDRRDISVEERRSRMTADLVSESKRLR
jgi:hypothetical protein